jgi:hypothetical protein
MEKAMPARTLPSAPRVTVQVTDELITQAVERDSSHCMIADAVKASVPDASFVSVDIQTIRFTRDGFRYTYLTPRRAQVELIKFDQGITPEPMQFQLRTGQTTRSGARRGARKDATGSQERTPAQAAATRSAMKDSTKPFGKGKTDIKFVRGPGQQDNIPEIRGGRVPPVAPLSNAGSGRGSVPAARRRSFGLRAMDALR